jgi:hypothetical protein
MKQEPGHALDLARRGDARRLAEAGPQRARVAGAPEPLESRRRVARVARVLFVSFVSRLVHR